MKKGKMSSIRRQSNKDFSLYDRNGRLKLSKLNKRDRKVYLESRSKELERLKEESRPPRMKRKNRKS